MMKKHPTTKSTLAAAWALIYFSLYGSPTLNPSASLLSPAVVGGTKPAVLLAGAAG